jgi:hypothetical protein
MAQVCILTSRMCLASALDDAESHSWKTWHQVRREWHDKCADFNRLSASAGNEAGDESAHLLVWRCNSGRNVEEALIAG